MLEPDATNPIRC